ncbi:unnamed protein product [Ilex paraguariensis]|uniref:Uncharacterized protein n=1 Tax=Ilex paraguariensis TaxID=185542 RepID=A0ABC8S6W9_9AQUA
MAEFPPNLDDGEMWLPSDIFPIDEVPSKLKPRNYSSELLCMEEIAQRFAVFASLERNRTQSFNKPHTYLELERFREPVRYGSVGSFPGGYCVGVNGGTRVGYGGHGWGNGGVLTGSRPVYQYELLNPVQFQFESFMEARVRGLQRQQVRFMQNRIMGRRFLPLQGNGIGVGNNGGGVLREYGGTGVFLPRMATTTTTNDNSDARKRNSVRNRQDAQFYPQRNVISVNVRKQEEGHCHLPPDMGLPQYWTY